MRTIVAASLLPSVLLLSACGGGGGDEPRATAPLSVRITDAPANAAAIDRVCLAFSRITVHYASGEDVVLDYNPARGEISDATHCPVSPDPTMVPAVRLNALGGGLTVALVESLQVPVGRITWIRLHLVPGGSYLMENDGAEYRLSDESLRCPSCEMTDNNAGRGFKLNRTFEVPSEGLAVTIDVDLGVSLRKNPNGYILRPTARIELDDSVGTIAGNVDEMMIVEPGVRFSGGDPDTGCSVYVFRDDATIDDYHMSSEIVTTARVRMVDPDSAPRYAYAAGALPEGLYLLALTCDPDDDANEELTFVEHPDNPVGVTAGQTTTANF